MGNRALCCGKVCPKTIPSGGDNDLEDSQICDPAGAIFQETLEDLSEADRLFLLFASSSNVTAVRWLRRLGANIAACDSNGTTSLHAACRSGSLGVVRALLQLGLGVNTTDVAGWTPLHVAVFMGRRAVVVHLLKTGADVNAENERSQTPSELSTDGWLREVISSLAAHRAANGGDTSLWRLGREQELAEDVQVSSRLRFEPFFVPRPSVLTDPSRNHVFETLGARIFNQRPGQGMAFLVASGSVRDFPIEISAFLRTKGVSRQQIGAFLGEDFSLSSTLRLEFVNSIKMAGTGVVSSLEKVLADCQFPPDLLKIDRLLDAVAQIWWRQHDHLKAKGALSRDITVVAGDEEEIKGAQLLGLVTSHGALQQLMFSTVLLHWNLYGPTASPAQRLSCEEWLELNEGIEGFVEDADDRSPLAVEASPLYGSGANASGGRVRDMQRRIYCTLSKPNMSTLQKWPSSGSSSLSCLATVPQGHHGTGAVGIRGSALSGDAFTETYEEDCRGGFSDPDASEDTSYGCPEADVQGWVRLLGGGFPSPAGATGTITYKHIRSILSEASMMANAQIVTPVNSRPDPGVPGELRGPLLSELHAGSRMKGRPNDRRLLCASEEFPNFLGGSCDGTRGRSDPGTHVGGAGSSSAGVGPTSSAALSNGDCLWLALVGSELFLAPKARGWAPYAFLHLGELVAYSVDSEAMTLTMVPQAPDGYAKEPRESSTTSRGAARSGRAGRKSSDEADAVDVVPQLELIFLLPDGRWQVIEVPELQVRVPDVRALGQWTDALAVCCKKAIL
eukprot:TRINITY_DN26891_c0_g3_i1.p1 TRINITY_DN26891_c0_g3~~TRINITY_DN26891_c0_g3_i1.p1  ORF type:complete len:790 (+),score=155.53 TRINITY_DN26891_c0_g3_i1:160-2529(+)